VDLLVGTCDKVSVRWLASAAKAPAGLIFLPPACRLLCTLRSRDSVDGTTQGDHMQKLLSTLMLALLATPAFAETNQVPEPETMGLVAAGLAAAVWIARRNKKK
jgi:hypothetical protein